MEGHQQTRVVWYFFKSGDRLNTNYWLHQATVTARKLTDPNAADILLRADTPVPNGDIGQARSALTTFLSAAVPHILTSLP